MADRYSMWRNADALLGFLPDPPTLPIKSGGSRRGRPTPPAVPASMQGLTARKVQTYQLDPNGNPIMPKFSGGLSSGTGEKVSLLPNSAGSTGAGLNRGAVPTNSPWEPWGGGYDQTVIGRGPVANTAGGNGLWGAPEGTPIDLSGPFVDPNAPAPPAPGSAFTGGWGSAFLNPLQWESVPEVPAAAGGDPWADLRGPDVATGGQSMPPMPPRPRENFNAVWNEARGLVPPQVPTRRPMQRRPSSRGETFDSVWNEARGLAPPQVPKPRRPMQRRPSSAGETFDKVWAEAKGY